MRSKTKKILSFIMTLILTTGMFSLIASAETTENNKINGVYAKKKASYDEKTGKVTLTLEIQGDKVDIVKKQNADVVLVVDNSSSMGIGADICGNTSFTKHIGWALFVPYVYYTCNNCGEEYNLFKPDSCTARINDRIITAISAANTFAEQILQTNSNNRLAIIGFSHSNDHGGANDWESIKVFKGFTEASGLSDVKAAINRMKASNGTNYSSALKKAADIIANREDKTRPAFVVFLSDGAPGLSGESIGNVAWDGSIEAQALKNSGVVIYTIGIALNEDTGEYLKSLATSDNHYYNVTNENYQSEMQNVLINIATKILKSPAGTNASIVDFVNTDLFEDIEIEGTGLTLDKDGNVVWNIGDIPEEVTSVSFTIKPRDGVYGDKLKTNKDVVLKYNAADGTNVERHKNTIGDPEIIIPSYTVTWIDGNGREIYKDTYTYGKMPVYNIAKYGVPGKTATAEYTYTFSGWSPEVVKVTKDAVYTAQFDSMTNQYTVTWVDGDGKEIYHESYDYGVMPSYNSETYGVPGKTATAEHTYIFNGWSPEIVRVTEDTTYTAKFDSTVNQYTVTWVDGDGKEIYHESYDYGVMPSYNSETYGVPGKTATAEHTYIFNGWSPEIVKVTRDTFYTAQFDSTTNQYTVTWVDGDGKEIYHESYDYGVMPSYNSETYGVPGKTATAEHTYIFNGWSPEIVKVTKDAVYTAQFDSTTNQYTVTWVDGDGKEIYHESYDYGVLPSYNSETYGVPEKTATAEHTYIFNGWSPEIVKVTRDTFYTAQFDSTVNQYTVTWVDGDGKEIYHESYEYGVMPLYNSETYGTPGKTATAEYTYTFNGWSPEIVRVTEDTTYTAKFDSTVNQYTVTWVDGDGKEIYHESYDYGIMPSYNSETYGVPGKTATAEHTYIFNGWSPEIVEVTEDATYTAQFDSIVNQYTITWVDGNGNTIYTEKYNYGETPVYDMTYGTPVKDSFEGFSYEFNGIWSPDIVSVTGDATYTAQFEELEEIPEEEIPLDPGKPTPTPNPEDDLVDIPDDSVPMTGDSSKMDVYVFILLTSLLGMVGAAVWKKEKFD